MQKKSTSEEALKITTQRISTHSPQPIPSATTTVENMEATMKKQESQVTPRVSSMELDSEELISVIEMYEKNLLLKEKGFQNVDVVAIGEQAVQSIVEEAEERKKNLEEKNNVGEKRKYQKRRSKTTPSFELLTQSDENNESQEHQQMAKRESQPSGSLKSPYKQRIVDMEAEETIDEMALYKWIEEGESDKRT